MRIAILQISKYEEIKQQFLDVFSNEPWFDVWEDEKQLEIYLHELIDNQNSLSLVMLDDNDQIIGGSLGYVFHWWEGKEYFIKEFFISRTMQNQGLGSCFLTLAGEYLKNEGIKSIWLSTHRKLPAYNFYKKNGFSELDEAVFLFKKLD